jgi:hypothetical protein
MSPGANRVFAGCAPRLGAAELTLTADFARDVEPTRVAGVDYVGFATDSPLDAAGVNAVARQSGALALFVRRGDLLAPVELPDPFTLGDNLVTIMKYPGKTNEQFTQLLVNLTLARVAPRQASDKQIRLAVLDPLAGRGTTLLTAWRLGCDGFGVEADERAVEALAAFLTTYLRRGRLHHTAGTTPVRREGRTLGRRFDATFDVDRPAVAPLRLTVFTGDTRDSAKLYGKRRFDAVVADAPYGVVHGARRTDSGRDRSPAQLLREALPVWASQLRPGGAMGLSWNTYGFARDDLLTLMRYAGLEPMTGGAWDDLAHRVDSSIVRDVAVAVKPVA